MAKIIKVGKKNLDYEVVIAKNATSKTRLSSHLKSNNKIFVVTDSGIPKKFIKELRSTLGLTSRSIFMSFLVEKNLNHFQLILVF